MDKAEKIAWDVFYNSQPSAEFPQGVTYHVLAARIRAYGEACRRAGAGAVREALKPFWAELETIEEVGHLQDYEEWTVTIGDIRQLCAAAAALDLPSAAEAAPHAVE